MFDDKETNQLVIRVTQFNMNAPVAQRIERRPPEPGAQVRVLPGAHCRGAYNETFLVFGAFTESKQVDNCSKKSAGQYTGISCDRASKCESTETITD